MDEARFGQQGTTTRVWAPRGSRPSVVKQTRYEWVYLYAAVEPSTGASTALQAPCVDTVTMNVFLEMLSKDLGADDHAVLILDRAGWHRSKRLAVPENITLLYLPPYAPELNPVEYVWAHLKQHELPNVCAKDLWSLGEMARKKLRRMRRRKPLIVACWKQSSLAFRSAILCDSH